MLEEQIKQTVRRMHKLNLQRKQRRDLIKESYSCLGRVFSIPETLNEGVEDSIKRELFGNEAYENIYAHIEGYEKKIIFSLSLSTMKEDNFF
jgi:hypothetical protein